MPESYSTESHVILYGSEHTRSGLKLRKRSGDNELMKHPDGVAKILRRSLAFATDKASALYIYRKGCYRKYGADFAREVVIEYLRARGMGKDIRPRYYDDIVTIIRHTSPKLHETPPLAQVNLLNGIYDVESKSLIPHSRELLSPIQLPFEYKPGKKPKHWHKFLREVFTEDCIPVVWEILAWMMVPYTGIKKLVLLLGDGNNGKSVFLKSLQSFIGEGNYSQTPLEDLIDDKFAAANLMHKLVNIRDEISNKKLSDTSRLKNLTGGGGPTEAQKKYGDRFIFTPYARYVFSANEIPKALDDSTGFFNRFCILPFPRTFSENPGLARQLEKNLTDPEELSGVFNVALQYLPKVLSEGIGLAPSMTDALDHYRASSNPVIKYLRARIVEKPNDSGCIFFKSIYEDYESWCKAKEIRPVPPSIFGKTIASARPKWKQVVMSTNNKYYVGLDFAYGRNGYQRAEYGQKVEVIGQQKEEEGDGEERVSSLAG